MQQFPVGWHTSAVPWLAAALMAGACATAAEPTLDSGFSGPILTPRDAGADASDAKVDGSDASFSPVDAGSPNPPPIADNDAGPEDGGSAAPDAGGGMCTDTDGDSLTDCEEDEDADPFTDRAIFNGVHVQTRDQSDNDVDCAMIDTLGEVRSAASGQEDQALDQYAGWDFDDTDDERTDPGHGFAPPWTEQSSAWQIDAVGHVQLEAGHHCFEVAGEADESCASLFVGAAPSASFGGWDALTSDTPATAQHGSGVACLVLAEGVYPIRWHYEMDNNRGPQAFHLRYCYDAAADCTPSEALPARMLRVSP